MYNSRGSTSTAKLQGTTTKDVVLKSGHNKLYYAACSNLGTGTYIFKSAGEIMVVPHKLKKTGYKAPNAYGARPLFSGET